MGLFSEHRIFHGEKRRSWWDGTCHTWCGLALPGREVHEGWFFGGITCRECLSEIKKAGK